MELSAVRTSTSDISLRNPCPVSRSSIDLPPARPYHVRLHRGFGAPAGSRFEAASPGRNEPVGTRSLPIERPDMGIWVGRYAIVAGEVREHGPWLVERRAVRDDEELRLLVLADPVDERSAEFAAEVAEAVAELFTRETLSVTGGLLRALRQAHANLAEWNRRSLREHQVAVGLTCLAIRDGEATVAQVGPGVVYIAGPEGVRRLSTDEEAAAQPIGGAEAIEPQFFSTPIADRTLLLLTGSVDQLVGTSVIGEALRASPERTLSELFVRTRGVRDMTAVLVAELDVEEYDEAEHADGQRHEDAEDEIEAAVVTADADGADGADMGAEPTMLAPVPSSERAPAGASAAGASAAGASAAGASAAGASAARDEGGDRPALAAVREEPEAPTAVDSGAPMDHGAMLTSKRRFPALRRKTASYPTPIRQPSGLGGSRLRTMGPGSNRFRGYALIALAILAVVVLAVCTLPSLLEEDRGAQLDDAVVAAQEHLAKANDSIDPAVTRSELQSALTEISRGRSVDPSNEQLDGLQQQVNEAMTQLDAVVDLGESGLARVIGFDGVVTAPFAPAAIVFGGDALWLLDSEQGRVLQVPADGQGEPAEVYRLDASYGAIVAREPSAVAWDDVAGRLLILDAERNLFSLTPETDPVPLPVRGIGDLKSAAAIASYDGNLYVLDPAEGEIWRYLPGGDGFDSERTNTLGGAGIEDARALAVDGQFYVLGAEGARHFRQDRELPPLFKGIDRALSSPAGIAVDAERELTYVADRGGRRVVVSDGEGNYLKQYRHPQFFDIRGVALSPDGNTVYVLTGDGIYSFTPTP